MQPTRSMFDMTYHGLRSLWDRQKDRASDRKKSLSSEMREIHSEIKKLVDRVIDTDNATLIAAYEKRIGEAEARKAELAEKLSNCGRPLASFEQAFRTSMAFLANPYKLWVSERIELKRTVLQLAFVDRLEYVRESGFRTPLTSSPFRLFHAPKEGSEVMAHPERFERPTLRFVV